MIGWGVSTRKYARETDRRTRTIDLCEPFDTVDLWIDPDPNAQLILIWLLEYFRPHEAVVSNLNLVQADVPIGNYPAAEVVADTCDRTRQFGVAGLSRADAAGLVRPAVERFEPAAVVSAGCHRPAGRITGTRDRTWRHGNADAGADLGR
jgi:hypothetical protein